jgi:hypothetical protein
LAPRGTAFFEFRLQPLVGLGREMGLLGHGRAGYFGPGWFDIVRICCDPGSLMSVHLSVVVIR